MTVEQYNKLKDYETIFRWAIESNFIHLSNGEYNKFAAIYAEVYKVPIGQAMTSCNSCRLSKIKQLGRDWFNKKEDIQKKEEERERERKKEEDNQSKSNTNNKKPGRPRKIDLNA